MKILVVIVNFGDNQLKYLDIVIKEYKSFTKPFEVNIVIHSNIPLDYEGVEVKIFDNLDDYEKLPFTTRQTVYERRNDYDLFIYSENDHIITQHNVESFLTVTNILPKPYIAGFMQYLRYGEGLFYPGYHLPFKWLPESVVTFDDYVFAHFTNVHQASFLLTKEQLHQAIEKLPNFLKDNIRDSPYRMKPRAGTDIYTHAGFKKVIPISHFDDFIIGHLPSRYRGKLGDFDEVVRKDIFQLKMSNIFEKYREKCNTPSDIHKHLPTLKKFAEKCEHITEMGVRWVTSTWALLAGKPKRMISYDMVYHPNIEEAKESAKIAGIDFEFKVKDVLDFEIEETDLLFLDTLHHYYQLSQELKLHGNKARKYIILHDTTYYKFKNEPIPDDVIKALKKLGKNVDKYYICEKKGLWPAIHEFLDKNNGWYIKKRFLKNNGLTILARVKGENSS